MRVFQRILPAMAICSLLASLLPLTVAAQTTGKNPSHADILRGFDAAAFWASREDVDYGGTYNPTGLVVKWNREIVYRVDGLQFKPAAVEHAVATLKRQAGIAGIAIRAANGSEEANFLINFRDVANFTMSGGRKAGCYMTHNYDTRTGHMKLATLNINLSSRDVDRCIVHETLHGFGLFNHPHKLHSVLSYYTNNFVFDLTEPDIVMLQTLYDPRLKAGASRLAGLILADGIIEEKRRALNPAAPPKTDSTPIFQAVIADLEKAAASGNMRAALYLAEAYRFGLSVPKDAARVRTILDEAERLATDQDKRFELAYALYGGQYAGKHESRAVALYRRNAELGHHISQNNLAVALRDGRGVAQDKREALMWFTIAAVSRNYDLAERNRQGLLGQLTPEDQAEAEKRAAAWKPAAEAAR